MRKNGRKLHPNNARLVREKDGRKAAIARLMLETPGISQNMIADRMGIHYKTVSKLVGEIHAEWKESALLDHDQLMAVKLAEIRHVKAEAWAAWKDKRFVREKVMKSTTIPAGGDARKGKQKILVITEQRDLGIECLKVVLECIRQESQLCGLGAPQKHEIHIVNSRMKEAHDEFVAAVLDILTPDQIEELERRNSATRAKMLEGLPVIDATAKASPGG